MSNRRKQANPRSLKLSLDDDENENQTELLTAFNLCPETTNFDFDDASRSSMSLHGSSDDTLETEAGGSWQSESADERRTPPTPSSCATPNSATELPEIDLTYTIGVTEATPYSCQFCTKAFPRLSYLKKHEQTHNDQMPFKCDFCARLFKYKRSRDRHVKLHTGDKKYRCTYCEAAFSRSDHLKIHLRTHDNGKPFQCVTCNRGYNTAAALTSHMQNHKKQQRLRQEQQQQEQQEKQQKVEETATDSTQQQSQPQESTSPTIKSQELSPKSDSQMQTPTELPTSGKISASSSSFELPTMSNLTLTCQICGQVMQSPAQLQDHAKYHTMFPASQSELTLENSMLPVQSEAPKTSRFTCTYCSEEFNTLEELSIHVEKEHFPIINGRHQSGDQANTPTTCILCPMQFSNIQSYYVHLAVNHRFVETACPFCPQKFETPKQLHDHYFHVHKSNLFRGQAMDSKFTCTLCYEDFDMMEQLMMHVGEKHYSMRVRQPGDTSVTPSTCCACPFKFTNVITYSIHLLMNHGARLSLCPFCSQSFDNSDQLADHFLRVHQSSLPAEQVGPADLSRKTKSHPYLQMEPFAKRERRSNGNTLHTESTSTSHSQASSTSTPTQLEYPNTFVCNKCNIALPDFAAFQDHLKIHLNPVENIPAAMAAGQLPDANQLRPNLLQILNNAAVLTCQICKMHFTELAHLEKHVMGHYLEIITDYNCKNCSRSFVNADQMRKHYLDVHTQQLLRCELCKELFDSAMAIQIHYATKHKGEIRLYNCIACQESRRFTFRTEKAWKSHMKTVHNDLIMSLKPQSTNRERSFQCKLCFREFNSDMEVQLHSRVHFEPFRCPICPQIFEVEYQLEMHMQCLHQGNQIPDSSNGEESNQRLPLPTDLPYPPIATKPSMTLHDRGTNCIKLETPDYKINSCDQCGRNDFTNESELISHRKIVHNVKSIPKNGVVSLHCAYCDKKNFKSRTELETHMKSHHQNSDASVKHKCNICDELYPSAALLAEHKLTHVRVVAGNNCTHCKATIRTDEQFYAHLIQHNNTNNNNNTQNNQINLPLPCVICRQTLNANIEVQKHAQFHIRNTAPINIIELQCAVCSKPLEKSNMASNNQNSNNVLCKDCFAHHNYSYPPDIPTQNIQKHLETLQNSITYNTETERHNHLPTHLVTDVSQHDCNICRNKFSSASKLQIHLIEHSFNGIGSYTCYFCSAVFTAAKGIHAHIAEHGLENRPYDCSNCESRFFFSAELEHHSYVHLQDSMQAHKQSNSFQMESYQCIECPHSFTDEIVYMAHMRSHQQSKNRSDNNAGLENVGGEDNDQPVGTSTNSDNEYIEVESPIPVKKENP